MTAMARFEQKKIGNKSQCILSLLRSFFVVFVPCHMHAGMYGLYLNVAGDDPNKQSRNKTSRGVSQQVRLGTILRVGKTRKPRKTKGDG